MWIEPEIEIFTNKVSVGIKTNKQRETQKSVWKQCAQTGINIFVFFIFVSLPCNLVMRKKIYSIERNVGIYYSYIRGKIMKNRDWD